MNKFINSSKSGDELLFISNLAVHGLVEVDVWPRLAAAALDPGDLVSARVDKDLLSLLHLPSGPRKGRAGRDSVLLCFFSGVVHGER